MIYRYIITTNPQLHRIRAIFGKFMIEHKKKYNFDQALCKLKLHFSNDITLVKQYMYR